MKKRYFIKQLWVILVLTLLPCFSFSQTWESYYKQAQTEYDNKNYKKCIEYCDQSLAITKTGEAYWERGSAKLESDNYSGAIEDYTLALPFYNKNSSLAKLYYLRGESYYKNDKYDEAITDFVKAEEYGYTNLKLLYWYKGLAYYYKANYEKAITQYRQAISLYTDEGSLESLYQNMARSYDKLGQNDEALNEISNALQKTPNKSYLFKVRAMIHVSQKKYELAKEDYSNAINLETDNKAVSDLYFERSWKLGWKTLDYKGALADLNKCIAMNPEDGMQFWHRSITLGNKKDYQKALADCDKAISIYSEKVPSGLYQLRASLKEKTGDFKGAIGDYQAALKKDDKNAHLYYIIGRMFKIQMKNNDLAESNFAKAIELDKADGTSSTYAYVKVISGEPEEAIVFILKNVEKSKDDSYNYKWALHNAACIYALAGNKTKSLEYLDKSMVAGFDDYDHLVNDKDLFSLTTLPQYKAIIAKYKVPLPKW